MTAAARRTSVIGLPALIIACLAQGAVDKKPVVFPGKTSTYPSSNGRYVLINVDDEKMEPPHKLLLKDAKTQEQTTLLSYNRWVAVLWSPSGSALIVNDHKESDEAGCLCVYVRSCSATGKYV